MSGYLHGSLSRGTAPTLNESPGPGSTFAGWSGPCTGSGVCGVAVTSDLVVTATFALPSVATAQTLPHCTVKPEGTTVQLRASGKAGPSPRLVRSLPLVSTGCQGGAHFASNRDAKKTGQASPDCVQGRTNKAVINPAAPKLLTVKLPKAALGEVERREGVGHVHVGGAGRR